MSPIAWMRGRKVADMEIVVGLLLLFESYVLLPALVVCGLVLALLKLAEFLCFVVSLARGR